ncbi:pilus assembly protein TadG-related protein [Paenarthrobacter sp. PH39-S1]|nr:pilus assembly protein TadG-related protein [Paenarthrobacter sp. PH39-S1]
MTEGQHGSIGVRARVRSICSQPHPRRPNGDAESGELMVMIIGYVVLALLLVTVVAAVSSVYLGHKKLLSAADGAAVAAADSFTLSGVAGNSGAPVTILSGDGVRAAASAYLNRNSSYRHISGLTLGGGTGTADGRTARVTLAAVVHPLFINFLIPDGIAVTATSTARSQLTR